MKKTVKKRERRFYVSPTGAVKGAAIMGFAIIMGACASITADESEQWAANGYLTPGPTSNPELIGIFDNEGECRAAADAWMSRQVVGNPIFAECLPIDRD